MNEHCLSILQDSVMSCEESDKGPSVVKISATVYKNMLWYTSYLLWFATHAVTALSLTIQYISPLVA